MLKESETHNIIFPVGIEKVVIMTYEINFSTITDELVETYNRLLHNDVDIADAYRDEAIENFEGTVSLFVLTGRIENNKEAFDYIEALKTRFSNCRKSFEEYNDEILIDYEKIGEECECDDSGFCTASCPMYWKCQH